MIKKYIVYVYYLFDTVLVLRNVVQKYSSFARRKGDDTFDRVYGPKSGLEWEPASNAIGKVPSKSVAKGGKPWWWSGYCTWTQISFNHLVVWNRMNIPWWKQAGFVEPVFSIWEVTYLKKSNVTLVSFGGRWTILLLTSWWRAHWT